NIFRDAARLGKDLIADRLSRFNHAGAAAIGTGRAERALKRLFDPFSGNRDKTEIVELQDFRWRAVASEFLLQGLHHFLPVLALFHIDEIEHDDAAQIAQSDLSNDLFRCFEVGLHNGVFQAIGFAHEFSGVDVNRDQRFGLINDDVAARFQPYTWFDGFVDLSLNAVMFQDRGLFRIELDAIDQLRCEAIDEIYDAFVFEFVINTDGAEIRRELVTQYSLHQIEIAMNNGRGFCAVGTAANVSPGAQKIQHIFAQFVGRTSTGRSADDEPARSARFSTKILQRTFQPLALFIGADLARNANVFDGWHINDITSGQCHM